MKCLLLDFLDFLQFRAFFSKPYQNQGFFWNKVIFVVFGLRGGGGWFLPGLLDFLEFLQFWALFFWNEIFVFGFSAVSSFFFQNLTRTRVFFLE